MKVSIIPTGPFNSCFLYTCEDNLAEGTIVKVPFQNRNIIGAVFPEEVQTDKPLKEITRVFPYSIGEKYIQFINWMSSYTLIPRGIILKMILAEKTVFSVKNSSVYPSKCIEAAPHQEIILNEEQLRAFAALRTSSKNRPFLLQGVTGSGKTEVYLKKAKEILDSGRQVLILFPEIALTNQMSKRIEKYLDCPLMVWNSNITPKNRRMAWVKANAGEKCIIIGARSSLFIPFKNLGLIVVDEEHDSSYKQEEGYFYNARDMAVVLAKILDIPIILSSATPSLESSLNARNNKYGFFNIESRYGNSKLPTLKLIDMRQNKFDGFISPPLLSAIEARISRHEQSLVYLNRRGYSPVTLCKHCGEKLACPNCSTWLVYHKTEDKLICHYCGHKTSIPNKCPSCFSENSYIPFGPGVERIHDELQSKIPSARLVIASSDTLSSAEKIEELLSKIYQNEVDIIIGTQILTKGHHFPNITLVGIIDGDLGLYGADIRSSEHSYQLINQVAGRAGREEKPGEILVQTFNSDHPLFKALQSADSRTFIDLETEHRKKLMLPPFTKFASIIISGNDKKLTQQTAQLLKKTCPKNVISFGPAPAPIFMMRGRVRWRILLKSHQKAALNSEISSWLSEVKHPKSVKIQIDIDPITFL